MPEEEKEKKELETKTEEKQKQVPWWQKLSPIMIGGGLIIGFLIFKGWQSDPENSSTYIVYFLILVGGLYLLSQTTTAKLEEVVLKPDEAEHLARSDCERKRRWGQFDSMVRFNIGPISQLQHKVARGTYYDVNVEVMDPYSKPKYYCATVVAKGVERGFVTLNEIVAPLNGREEPMEKPYIPEWFRHAQQSSIFEKLLFRGREF